MTTKALLVDDLRTELIIRQIYNYSGKLEISRSIDEAIELIKKNKWDILFLDHDMGADKTGYDLICWLEENPEHWPGQIVIVSANPVGRDNIQRVIDKYERNL